MAVCSATKPEIQVGHFRIQSGNANAKEKEPIQLARGPAAAADLRIKRCAK